MSAKAQRTNLGEDWQGLWKREEFARQDIKAAVRVVAEFSRNLQQEEPEKTNSNNCIS